MPSTHPEEQSSREHAAARIANLSPAKLALLTQRVRGERGRTGAERLIRPRPSGPIPLSFAQEQLWFLNQLDPRSPVYNIPAAFRLNGALNRTALVQSFSEIVRRHEVLRTGFVMVDGQLWQQIRPAHPQSFHTIELRDLPQEDREAIVLREVSEEASRPFDLAHDSLLRLSLFQLSESDHMLLVTLHHIVSDAWSAGVIIRELGFLYEAYLNGRPSPLPDLPLQYADFACWQRHGMQGEVLVQKLAYWKRVLDGAPLLLELPADRPRPAVQTFNGGSHRFLLSPTLSKALKQWSQQEGVSLFMTLIAAFGRLIGGYTGLNDFLIGVPMANRRPVEVEGLIGFFMNTVPVRMDLSESPSFQKLVRRTRDMALEAYAYQDLPFEKLVEALQPQRALSHSPLVQVLFSHQSTPLPVLNLNGLTVQPFDIEKRTAKFDLVIDVDEGTAGLVGSVEYNRDLFEPSTIDRLCTHYTIVLQESMANPQRQVQDMSLMEESERHQVVVAWNTTAMSVPDAQSLPMLFQAQVEQGPDATAVVCGDQMLTYEELNRRANQVAHRLRALGVGPDVRVGVCLDPSTQLIVGILGILKAEGAYVPIDPAYPATRREFMLADAKAHLVLTQKKFSFQLPHSTTVLYVDEDDAIFVRERDENPVLLGSGDNLAYVIYTSGSTGQPKGVAVSHRNVAQSTLVRCILYPDPVGRFLLLSSIAFDSSIAGVFWTLSQGGQLVLLPEAQTPDPTQIAALVNRHAVTHLLAIPSLWDVVLAQASPEALTSLRVVIVAGEACPWKLVGEHRTKVPQARLYNEYGPTEGTVWSTVADLTSESVEPMSPVPIGRPIPNTQTYVLDERGQPVPIGIPAELYIGGGGIARGYIDRPELTAERFLPNPFEEVPGARLYRTGDRVRWRVDGWLEFLGRVDQQVKIRGHRIELGEIEAVVRQHTGVRDTVVIVREGHRGNKQVVAYVVGTSDTELFVTELRRFVTARVPEYLVPAAFVMMDVLPLTSNGKVDRKALPAPNDMRSEELESLHAVPRTPREELMASIWTDLLGIDHIGSHDNFFELGGHSLLATQVMARAREIFQADVALRAFFEAPTVAGIAKVFDEACQADRNFVDQPIEHVPRGRSFPLSFAQERLWFLAQLEPTNPFYNIATAVRLNGVLNQAALGKSLHALVQRHEVLRTTFVLEAGYPRQVIASEAQVVLETVDLGVLTESEYEAALNRLTTEEATGPFDLAQGPLLRVRLIQRSETEHRLLLTLHHIVSDGWSMGVLVRDLGVFYESFLKGIPPPLPPLTIQYVDFAAWQRQQLQGKRLEAQIAEWTRQFAEAPPLLELPTDRPRPAVQSFRGTHTTFALSTELMVALKALSQREGVTLFMTMVAAFATLLNRYTGQEDLVIGVPIANRRRLELEDLMGFFVNTLVLRIDLSGQPTFQQLVHRVRRVMLDAQDRQDVPFEKLVEVLQPVRALSHNPLFQVMLVMQNTPMPALQLGEVTVTPTIVDTGATKCDLTLSLQEGESGIEVILEYSTDLFDATTITRLMAQFERLLEGIVSDPMKDLRALPICPEAQRNQILMEWNQTAMSYPLDRCLHEWIEMQAARTPEAVAVVYEGQTLTYGELIRRANHLAQVLRARGVKPDVVVGVCLERSLELIIGLVGILKAGGAYLPLDPEYPAERLAYMIEDAQAPVLVTVERLRESVPSIGAELVCLDVEAQPVGQQEWELPQPDVQPANVAYVIYTSGTTGRPKGVMVPHRGICNRLLWMQEAYSLTAGDRVLQKTPLSFDVSVWEWAWPLMVGATVVLARPGGQQEPLYLTNLIHQENITTVHFVPSMLRVWLQERTVVDCQTLQRIICSGEALSAELVVLCQQQLPCVEIHNLYGPTEASVDVSAWACPPGMTSARRVSLGRPIANTQLYVLDRQWELTPIGAHGELYIGGEGLARGYLNRPDLTAEQFIPDPLSQEPGARLYRTGDWVRQCSDGNLEYIGRQDQQVKIRGMRIELGEVEAMLRQYPDIQEAVVMVREENYGEKRLVAYLVRVPERSVTVTALRQFLLSRGPQHLIPSAMLFLEALPLMANGKVDRRALPAPESDRSLVTASYREPRTMTEELLVGLWTEVLGHSSIGIHDNFFELGGHSLLATQVMARARDIFLVDVPLRALFEAPTVEGLAQVFKRARRSGTVCAPPSIERRIATSANPLSYAQERLWFLAQLEPDSSLYHITGVVRLEGALQHEWLQQSFNQVITRHEILRTTFRREASQLVQRVVPELHMCLPVEDVESTAGKREAILHQRIQAEIQRPFDMEQGPLVRARLFRLSETEHVLVLVMHHIVADGWSMGILVCEVGTHYEAFLRGCSEALPALSIQYGDFAVWQRQWLQGPVVEEQETYWRQQLAGAPPLLELPTDHPRPAVQRYRGAQSLVEFNAELVTGLKMLSRQEGVTLFMTLLAGLATILARYSRQREIVIGTPVANRVRTELESLIGCFVNTLALRMDLSGRSTVKDLLRHVREVTLGAYAHQDLPFEKLVELLQPDRDLSHAPLFQVMLVLQNAPMPQMELSGLTLSSLRVDTQTAKFDVTVMIEETTSGLTGVVEYNTDLFDTTTIDRLINHWQGLLAHMVRHPECPVADMPLVTDTEWETILKQSSPSSVRAQGEACLHELFEAQVERSPEAIAVTCQGRSLTYRDVNWWANQVAQVLRQRGVGPDTIVALCLERSLELVVGILAILKAGGAYVPLDPVYPSDRLAFMLRDCGARMLVTQKRWLKQLSLGTTKALCLDADAEVIAKQNEENLHSGAVPQNLAYVIYTSGSTGVPKGVLVSHENVVRLFSATQEWFHFTSQDVWLLLHSYAFDFSVWELWGAWLYGGRLVVVSRESSCLPDALIKLICQEGVTVLNQTPSAFRPLLQAAIQDLEGKVLPLRVVVFGGEALSFSSLQPWLERYGDGGPRLVNMYGITETTVHVTYRPISQADEKESLRSLIGGPLGDLQTFVLDQSMQPVPIGVPGELYVGGAGVARGYLNRPELTAERFIPHPFAPEAGSRLYRSGDLVRWTVEGDLEYLGRVDHQVKVRGFRIELGEVSAVIQRHPGVKEVVVTVYETPQGNKELLTYVVRNAGAELSLTALRRFVTSQLPDYMVPTAMVFLETMPLTANGKINHRALPAPGEERPELEARYVTPRTPTEELLAGLWSQCLRVEHIGIRDNFFELGGHSLLAARLVAEVRTVFGVDVPLRTLFESPTIESFAEVLEEVQRQGGNLQGLPLVRRTGRSEWPLSFAQERLWFLAQLEPDSPGYHIVGAIRIEGDLRVEGLEASVNAVLARHEILRTYFVITEGGPSQQVKPMLRVSIPVEDVRGLTVEERMVVVQQRAQAEARCPFDLSQDPLLRMRLIQIGEQESVLLVTLHHIVADGWSVGILVREVGALYEAYANGTQAQLAELPIQYGDFAEWQRQWLTGTVWDKQVGYWREQLAHAPAGIELLTDHPRTAIQSFKGARYAFTVSSSVTAALKKLGQCEGTTLFMTLLAGYAVLLARYSGQEDVVIGAPIANRTRAEVQPLIGCFVNTLVLRVDLSKNPTVRDLLRRVREITLGAYAHQDLPFETLVDLLQPGRDLSHTPLVQTMFALQHDTVSALTLPGVTLSPMDVDPHTAKFDIALVMEEQNKILHGVLEYNTDLFEAGTIMRFVEHFQNVLNGMVANQNCRIQDLPLLGPEEQAQIFGTWSGSLVEFPREHSVCRMFEAQVVRSPEAVAVVCGTETLTYAELDCRAQRLAQRLTRLGVGPEKRVGIALDRSLNLIIAILATLKAGGTYVPLDPTTPGERIRLILQDAQASVVIVSHELKTRSTFPGITEVQMDTLGADQNNELIDRATDEVSPDHLAYVIYTSGSTGIPKGVMVTHRSLLNLVLWHQREFAVSSCDRATVVASPAFDASVWEIWPYLTAGATIHIPDGDTLRMPVQLRDWIVAQRITISFLPTPLAEPMLSLVWPENTVLRVLLTGGDQLRSYPSPLLPFTVVNNYGPTENTVVATSGQVFPVRQGRRLPSIGRPISNVTVYLLDSDLSPVPIGVPGELCIEGVGLARGYERSPDLTAERFVPNPFSPESGARLYRTGDRARWRLDGSLEFLGRLDHQMKIRGYRIDPGEVEAALRRQEGVHDAVIIVREDIPGEKRLVAYVVLEPHHRTTVTQLRMQLVEYVPAYMVPAVLMVLDEIPLTPNGKVDRRALSQPTNMRPDLSQAYIAPRTQEEDILATIFKQVLGVEHVGVEDNFFELGGDSIRSIQIVMQANQAGLRLTPKTMFLHQTIAELARAAAGNRALQNEQDFHPEISVDANLNAGTIRKALAQLKHTHVHGFTTLSDKP